MAERVSTTRLLDPVTHEVARMRGNAAALLVQIHTEDAEKFEALRRGADKLDSVKSYE
jgi:hypothetical protein